MLFRKDINGELKSFTPIKPRQDLWHRDMLYIPSIAAQLDNQIAEFIQDYYDTVREINEQYYNDVHNMTHDFHIQRGIFIKQLSSLNIKSTIAPSVRK